MDKAIARHSVRTALQLGQALTDYLDLARGHTSDLEFHRLRTKVIEAIDKINVALIDPSVSSFPELNEEIESSLEKYGKYL